MAVLDGATKAEVARRFGYPWSTINSIMRVYENTGRMQHVNPGGAHRRRLRLEQRHLDAMAEFISQHPAATLRKIKANLVERYPDVSTVGIMTISRALNERAHITLKRMSIEHARHNSEETMTSRQNWMAALQAEQRLLANGLFFDEAGFNLHVSCSSGRAPQGDRTLQQGRPAGPGQNLSLEVAVDRTGIIRSEVVVGAYNTKCFVRFLREDVLTAPGVCGHSRMFVMDNVAFHRSEEVCQVIEGAGHLFRLLPPYSPWLNLAEYVFSKVKPLVSRQELRDRSGLINVIHTMLRQVTAQDCEGYLREVGRNAEMAALKRPLGRQHDAAEMLGIVAND